MVGDDPIKLFLCGDVMPGRGVDQALPSHCDPQLHEDFVKDARDYVRLAERAHGPFRRPLGFADLWGDALAELDRAQPDLRLINLETSVTASDDYWRNKGINYRMHPGNLPCLTAAGIQCCSLANNHVLDWGYPGLRETLDTLGSAGIGRAGAGRNLLEAQAPAVFPLSPGRRVLVFAVGSETSGIPAEWAAGDDRAGVALLPDLSPRTAGSLAERMGTFRQPGDLVVLSIHWGPNWRFLVEPEEVEFAHRLIDSGAIDVLHGHSSHHVKGIEVYRGKLILYGCGDLLDDYEGIGGHHTFRGDLGLMYLPSFEAGSGDLQRLELVPTTVQHFQVVRAEAQDASWLRATLSAEGRRFGTRALLTDDGRLELRWR